MAEDVVLGGRYRLQKQLGKGGMGEVYLAVDERLGRQVAVKVLPRAADSDPQGVHRFIREAKLAATLQHPGITVVHDIDVDDNVLYLVMELLNGQDLDKVLERYPRGLPLDKALDFGIQISAALGAAHAAGVVHRDLKPGNIMVLDDRLLKICDFGLARHVSSATGLTGSGVLGTPVYMAPEQFLGRAMDGRTDLYLFGGVLHEMLCGQPPFPVDQGLEELVQGHLKHTPRGPKHFNPQLPDDAQRLVLDLLAKEPGDRPQDTATVIRRLEAIKSRLTGPSDAPEPADSREAELERLHRQAARFCYEGRFQEALNVADQAAQGRAQVLGPEHPDTLSTRNVLGSALFMLGRGPEAEQVVHGVAQARSRVHGPEHPKTMRSWLLLAKILYQMGRPGDAWQIAQGISATRARVLGPENVETLDSRNTEAWALHVQGRNPEALPVAYEVANSRGRVLGGEHSDTIDSRLLLGRVQHAMGMRAEAYGVATELHADCLRLFGPHDQQTVKAQDLLNACQQSGGPGWPQAGPPGMAPGGYAAPQGWPQPQGWPAPPQQAPAWQGPQPPRYW